MKKRIALVLLSSGMIFATAFGATSAAWAVTDNADEFGIKISVDSAPVVKHTVTYYVPDIEDQQFKQFFSDSIEVDEGSNLYTVLNEYTEEVNGFNFVNWHSSSDHFRNDDETQDVILDTKTVTEDITVYGKFVKANTFYYHDGSNHNYVTNTVNDKTIQAKTAYIGDWIYSYDGVEGGSIDLISESGIYKLENTGTSWNILRKVSFGISSVSSWWTSAGAHTHIYTENVSGSGSFIKNVAFDNNKATYYINYDVNKFVVCRSPSDSTDWTQFWNQTIDTTLKTQSTGSTIYGKDHITLYVQDSKTGNKQDINWW